VLRFFSWLAGWEFGRIDRHLAFPRHAEGGEEGNGGWEVVDDDADVIHSLDRHVPILAGGDPRPQRISQQLLRLRLCPP